MCIYFLYNFLLLYMVYAQAHTHIHIQNSRKKRGSSIAASVVLNNVKANGVGLTLKFKLKSKLVDFFFFVFFA